MIYLFKKNNRKTLFFVLSAAHTGNIFQARRYLVCIGVFSTNNKSFQITNKSTHHTETNIGVNTNRPWTFLYSIVIHKMYSYHAKRKLQFKEVLLYNRHMTCDFLNTPRTLQLRVFLTSSIYVCNRYIYLQAGF